MIIEQIFFVPLYSIRTVTHKLVEPYSTIENRDTTNMTDIIFRIHICSIILVDWITIGEYSENAIQIANLQLYPLHFVIIILL